MSQPLSTSNKTVAVSVSLGCLVSILVSALSFSYFMGGQKEVISELQREGSNMELAIIELTKMRSEITGVALSVNGLKSEISDLRASSDKLSNDVDKFNLFVAREQGKQDALKELKANGIIE